MQPDFESRLSANVKALVRRSAVISVLREFGIEERGERYCVEAVAALMAKEKLVRITFNYFQLPTAATNCL